VPVGWELTSSGSDLTLSSSVMSNGYTSSVQGHTGLTHHFYFFDIRAHWRSGLRAGVPEYQKIKKGGLDQYGAERFCRLIVTTIRKSVGLKGLKNAVINSTKPRMIRVCSYSSTPFHSITARVACRS